MKGGAGRAMVRAAAAVSRKSALIPGRLAGASPAIPGCVPTISRFFGIVIAMYYDDHAPPHFHARYGGQHAAIGVDPLGLIGGELSPRALGLVIEWARLHRSELLADWDRAREGRPRESIEPLI